MFLKTLNLVVNLTFLLLAIVIMTILLKNDAYRQDVMDFKGTLESFQLQNKKIDDSNLLYTENRINRLSENVDSYQSTTDSRLSVLETRVKMYESDKRQNQKMIQNNLNVMTNNNEQK